jgi:TPR repeat protein
MRLAAEAGNATAMSSMATMFASGANTVAWLKRAADKGLASAAFELGEVFKFGLDGVDKDDWHASQWLRKAARLGHREARTLLAVELIGEDEEISIEVGAYLVVGGELKNLFVTALETVAATGDASAFEVLGTVHECGLFKTQVSDDKAAEFYERAAEKGSSESIYRLVELYERTNRPEQAVAWCRKGVELDEMKCVVKMGCFHLVGFGVEKNAETANVIFSRAAERQCATAMHNLGVSFEEGRGVARDLDMAFLWFKRASDLGDGDAKRALERYVHIQAAAPVVAEPCAKCGVPAANRCARCLNIKYCSIACQHAHWKMHKASCKVKG